MDIECRFGCIFIGNQLHGDCRIPESADCVLNIWDRVNEEKELFSLEQLTEVFDYLDSLRLSGAINMFGARVYVENEFTMSKINAGIALKFWRETHSLQETSKVRAEKSLDKTLKS